MSLDKPVTAWLSLIAQALALVACAPTFPWVGDPGPPPSCAPDRALTWEDFSKRAPVDDRRAATAVRFRIIAGPPARFQVVLDPQQSWVAPELLTHWNPFVWSLSAHVLRHEQLHFAISCVETRQANARLTPGADLRSRLLLLEARAIRRNAQYDAETRHGNDVRMQQQWERGVRAELIAGPLPAPIIP